ncbi:MAG: hypothetical protein JOZ81_10400 [Chloroflexi bacterium]|nr:hypothetical protein [Chloroflexota bacterium]
MIAPADGRVQADGRRDGVRVVFVSYRRPAVDGDGGNHRTYQILLDLQAEFGPENVWSLSLEEWIADSKPVIQPTTNRWRDLVARMRRRAGRTFENPYKLLTREAWSHSVRFGTRGVLRREFVQFYRDRTRADLCVVDHPMFDDIRSSNQELGISTVIATHNIESLDVGRVRLDRQLHLQAAGVDFANELYALARYDERFAISKVEASLLTGVGLSCHYYPYLPCGQIRENLLRIAHERQRRASERDLFLIVGTANHAPTRKSLEWFLEHATLYGLPAGARVVVVGDKVTQLALHKLRGVEIRGRVSQAELQRLLLQACCAIVPQRMGFGALTRLPELACAGVPTLTFPHAALAIDPPPGVRVLTDDRWHTLSNAMMEMIQRTRNLDVADYEDWERRTARPFAPAMRRILESHAVTS